MKNNGLIDEMRKIFLTIEIFELKFSPIEKIVYGFTGLILTAFATALVILVIKK
jgi:hypothetical protein